MKARAAARQILIVAATMALGAATAIAVNSYSRPAPTEHNITITARRYAYEPPRIHVNQGDTVRLRLVSKDVIHGFFLEGHDIDAEIRPQQRTLILHHPQSNKPVEDVNEITFVASRRGKFRYRCSHTCGSMHPFMSGELIVGPNTPLHAGVGSTIGLFLGMLLSLRVGKKRQGASTT